MKVRAERLEQNHKKLTGTNYSLKLGHMKKEWLVIAEKKAAVNLTKTMHALPATPRELY